MNLNTITYNEDLTIASQTTQPIRAYADNANTIEIKAPVSEFYTAFMILQGLKAGVENPNLAPTERLYMSPQTAEGVYNRWTILIPGPVLNDMTLMKSTGVRALVEFWHIDGDCIGVKKYDTEVTEEIVAALEADFPDATAGQWVRVVDTDTDWIYVDGTGWEDYEDKHLVGIQKEPTSAADFALEGGIYTGAPSHLPTSTELILAALSTKLSKNGGTMLGDINMNSHNISTVGGITFDISTSETADTIGKIVWDADHQTLAVAMSASHIYRFGQQLVVYVWNKTGSTLTKGTPVYVYGELASSGKVLVERLSNAKAEYANAQRIAGMAAGNIANNGSGFVIFQGQIQGIDLSDYTVNDVIYVGDTAGTITNIYPEAPKIKIALGIVYDNSEDGILLLSPKVHRLLGDLSDVKTTSPANLDVLAYDTVNARWRNYDLMTYLSTNYLNRDGSLAMTGALDMDSHKVTNVTDGSDPGDAVNYGQYSTDLAAKADLVGGLVPSTQLPSYVDDVLEYATYADLPATGEAGKIYVVIADETSGGNTSTYRWATSVYIQVTDTLSASEAKTLYESNADTNAFTDAEKTKLGTLLSGTYYYSAAEIDALLESLKTVYGLTETVIDTLAHNGTVALADLIEYDFLTIYLKHTETSTLIFDGKLIDPALFVNNGDFIQINAFDAGVQRSYGKLTYDGSTNLTFIASDTADTLVIHGYKKGAITELLVTASHSGTNYLDSKVNAKEDVEELDAQIKANADNIIINTNSIAINTTNINNKADLVNGIVPETQLPSYIADILEYDSLSSFPAIGSESYIYYAIDTGISYRWTGSVYISTGNSEVIDSRNDEENGVDYDSLKERLDAITLKFQSEKNNNILGLSILGKIKEARESLLINVIGDSTGNETGEWVYLLAQKLAAETDNYNVNYYLYDNANNKYANAVQVKNIGAARKLIATPGSYSRRLNSKLVPINATNHDVDLRVKFKVADWLNGTSRTLFSKDIASDGYRCWKIVINSSNNFLFQATTDGTAATQFTVGYAATTATLPTDTEVYMRFVFDADDGAGNKTFGVYSSSDNGDTWDIIGSRATSAGTKTIFKNDSVPYTLLSTAYTCGFAGEIYSFELMDEIDGINIAPRTMEAFEHYTGSDTASQALGGSLEINIYNGSISGYGITQFIAGDLARRIIIGGLKNIIMINTSHNESWTVGPAYETALDSLMASINSAAYKPLICFLTQNPELDTYIRYPAQAQRRTELINYAKNNGYQFIDTYYYFIKYVALGGTLTDLIASDGIHPLPAGQTLWTNAIWNYINI